MWTDVDLTEEFDDYSSRVYRFGLTWWAEDDFARSRLAAQPGRALTVRAMAENGEVVETAHVYRDEQEWDADRKQLHGRILAGLLPLGGDAPARPAAVYLLGMPGSGKTSVLSRMARNFLAERDSTSPLICDADAVRVRLPEYRSGLGSQVVQTETADVVYGTPIVADLIERGVNVLVDVVGNPDHIVAELELFASRGYELFLLCASIPVEVAVERVKARAIRGGRYVPLAYVRSRDGVPQRALAAAVMTGHVRAWAVVETIRDPPRIVDAGDDTFGSVDGAALHWKQTPSEI